MEYSKSEISRHSYFYLFSLLTTILLVSCGTSKNLSSNAKRNTEIQKQVVNYGKLYLYRPYRYGTSGPSTFDCSGFTSFVFKKFGYTLHRGSAEQDKQVASIRSKDKLQTADLVFFEGRSRNGRVGHVGIVTETFPNGTFNFIHASTSQGVIISSSTEPYYAVRYLRGGQILPHDKISAEDNGKKKADYHKKDKSYNAFIAAKPKKKKNDIAEIDASRHIATNQKEGELQIVQHIAACDSIPRPSLSKVNEDSLCMQQQEVIASQHSDKDKNAADKNERNKVSEAVIKAMTWQDSVSVPKPAEKEIKRKTSIADDAYSIKHYIIKPGETLYSLSRQFECTIDNLIQWNPKLKEALKTGDVIEIRKPKN